MMELRLTSMNKNTKRWLRSKLWAHWYKTSKCTCLSTPWASLTLLLRLHRSRKLQSNSKEIISTKANKKQILTYQTPSKSAVKTKTFNSCKPKLDKTMLTIPNLTLLLTQSTVASSYSSSWAWAKLINPSPKCWEIWVPTVKPTKSTKALSQSSTSVGTHFPKPSHPSRTKTPALIWVRKTSPACWSSATDF